MIITLFLSNALSANRTFRFKNGLNKIIEIILYPGFGNANKKYSLNPGDQIKSGEWLYLQKFKVVCKALSVNTTFDYAKNTGNLSVKLHKKPYTFKSFKVEVFQNAQGAITFTPY